MLEGGGGQKGASGWDVNLRSSLINPHILPKVLTPSLINKLTYVFKCIALKCDLYCIRYNSAAEPVDANRPEPWDYDVDDWDENDEMMINVWST